MLVDNSLSGPIGAQPSAGSLAATAREGTVTVAAPGRAAYSATQLVHGLTTVEVGTGYHRSNATPRLEAALPSAPWHLRFYAYLPGMQAAGNGSDEVRWVADLGTHGLVLHETSGGNIGLSLQASGFDAAPLSPTLSGAAVAIGQWLRIEVTSDGVDTVARVYPGHATTGERVATWSGVGLAGGTIAEVTAYRYRAGAWLTYAPATYSAEVQTYQQRCIDLGYPAPEWGADGYYGSEFEGQLEALQADYGLPLGAGEAEGGVGGETLATIDLAWGELQGDPAPPSTYLSHLAVDDVAVGPASTPGTGATLAATSAVGSTGSKHTDTTATVAGEGSVSSTASKHTTTTATLSATGSVSAEVAAQHVPTFPPRLTAELGIDGEWVNITSDVRTREDLNIRRGRADEAARADPSALSLLLNNRHGRYSPRNPYSPYYGRIGRNTPIRVRAGQLPDPGVTLVADTFDRTEVDGWGSPDTGPAWTQTSGDPDQVWVSGGAGHLAVDTIGAFVGMTTSEDVAADFDATWEVSADTLPRGALSSALYLSADVRRATIDGAQHAIRLSAAIRAFSGAVDGRCRIGADIAHREGASYYQLTELTATVQDATYAPGEWLAVRCVLVGPQVRMKVWPADAPEPPVWIAQAYVAGRLDAGPLTLHAHATTGAADTPLPVTVSYRNVRVATPTASAPAVRFVGEISAWPPRWDLSDSDVWVPIQAAGISRRLGQGQKPLLSPLRRGIPDQRPLAYWPMEDGAEATQAAEVMGTAAPLSTSGLVYAEVDSLLSSEPVPEVRPGARIRSGHIPSQSSGAWEVDLLCWWEWDAVDVNNVHEEMLGVYSSTLYVRATAAQFDGRPYLTVTAYDLDGTELADDFLWLADNPDMAVEWFGQWNRWRLRAWDDAGTPRVQLGAFDRENNFWGVSVYPGTDVGTLDRIDTRFGEVGDLAIGHITAWGSHTSVAYASAMRAYAGETTTNRLSRLSVGSGVPILVDGDADTPLGTEARGTVLDGVGAATDADLGAPGELREELGLSYRARNALYDQDPVITLDYASGHISDPVEPVDDDQAIRNDIEVKREHGSSYQAVDVDGPLGVDTVGRYDESVTLSLEGDTQLPDQAGWRLHLGTVDELRWPTIRVNLANPRMREYIPTILGLDAGDRIRITNPPHWTQARDLDLIVQGYEERLGAYAWDLTLTCTPASPWIVAHTAEDAATEPDAPERADTAGSELAAPATAETTLLDVATTTGPAWITSATHPTEFPVDVFLGGEIVRVVAIADPGASPMVGAGGYAETATTTLVAPSVTAQATSLLVCAWTTFGEPGGTFTLPAGMTGLGGTGGVYSAQVAATEPVGAGATGERTATLDVSDAWSSVSVAVAGDGITPAVEETVADRDGADVTLTTSSAPQAGWWLLAIHGWDWDTNDVMRSAEPSGGSGWTLVGDSVQASSDTSRTRVWARQVTTPGVQEVTLPTGDAVSDNHARLVVLSGVAPSTVGQAFTVTRAINTIVKSHEAGTRVRLATPAVTAL